MRRAGKKGRRAELEEERKKGKEGGNRGGRKGRRQEGGREGAGRKNYPHGLIPAIPQYFFCKWPVSRENKVTYNN